MKRITYAGLIVSLFFVTAPLTAQNETMSIMAFGTYVQPVGNFGKAIGEYPAITRRFGFDHGSSVGLAQRGWGAGVEIRSNVLAQHFFWVVSGRVLMNTADVSSVTSYFRRELGDTSGVAFNYGTWLNIPVLTGFAYAVPWGDDLQFYASVQGGLNLTREASRKATINGVTVEETTFNMMPDFGYEIGCGVELKGKFNVSVRYLNLGTPRYDGTRRLNEAFFSEIARRETYIQADERTVSMVNLMLGYTLW